MDVKFRRAFIEITNTCNLSCGFCVLSNRPRAFMGLEKFRSVSAELKGIAEMVSLHVLGEPFMHPQLPEILGICSETGLNVNLVTNGTLLDRFVPAILVEKCLKQISFSVHALAALPEQEQTKVLDRLINFAASKPGKLIVSFRLRGVPGDPFVKAYSERILGAFKPVMAAGSAAGIKLADKVFLNGGGLFQWPGGGVHKPKKKGCLGLRHHFAVLSGGEVVPCCADYDGKLSMGNINHKPLSEILRSPAVAKLRESIAARTPMPAYCSACGFTAPIEA